MQIKRREVSAIDASLYSLPPLLQRIYAARGIAKTQQLDYSLKALLPFHDLTGIDQAVSRLIQALERQQRILIIGDFDADGATSSALAVSALKAMGAQHVEFLVPNRFEFGYGLTPGIVEVARRWHPQLIITVDNGIASHEGMKTAQTHGIDVIITDHHLPAEQLPTACAIVNPNQAQDHFASKAMAGVGVIFYVMLALRRALIQQGWFDKQQRSAPNMASFLDLVALGSVADVVPLDHNNRIMIKQGIQRIQQGCCRPGIRALLEIAKKNHEHIQASDLGFSVAPRLNAAGRLDDMSLGISCLLSESMEKARQLAKELDQLNQERRKIESEMQTQALQSLKQLSSTMQHDENSLPIALCLYDKTWHQGVIGLVASRLKERYHRPVIAFAAVSDTEMKGSARSVTQLNIRDVLAAIDRDYPGLITKFGGHAMAAGLSLHPKHFEQFRQAYVAEVSKHLDLSLCQGELWSDGPLAGHELTLLVAQSLRDAGPWGQHFPEPIFDNAFELIDQRLVGQHHLKMTLKHPDHSVLVDAIAFNVDLNQWPNHRASSIHIAYQLDINEFRDQKNLQLIVLDMNSL